MEPGLYHLDPERFDLPEENAAIIAALVRVHHSAIGPQPAGRLAPDELRVVHERVATYYGLDLRDLVRRELQRLAAAQRRSREIAGPRSAHHYDSRVGRRRLRIADPGFSVSRRAETTRSAHPAGVGVQRRPSG
jgi:hypothetical protein